MKSTWKKIGNFVSLNDLKREVIYLRKYEYWRGIAFKMGLKWSVPQIMLYFKNDAGERVEKMWDYKWEMLHEEYKIAKFAFVEMGMLGWTNSAADSYAYKAGLTKKIGKWELKLWNVKDGETDLLTQNEYVSDLLTRYYIRRLHENIVPWRKGWSGQEMPQNLETGQIYRGINLLTALFSGGTYFLRKQQILDLGGTIRIKADKYPMVFYKWYNFVLVESNVINVTYIGNMWLDEWGKIYPKAKVKRGWFLRHFYVYDVEKMVTGLEHMIPEKIDGLSPIEKSEDILREMPEQYRQDITADRFSDLFQKIAVKTTSNLNYPADYNKDMIADFATTFLCAEGGVNPPAIESHEEFVESALKLLKSDRNLLIRSGQVASKVTDLILNRPSYETNDD